MSIRERVDLCPWLWICTTFLIKSCFVSLHFSKISWSSSVLEESWLIYPHGLIDHKLVFHSDLIKINSPLDLTSSFLLFPSTVKRKRLERRRMCQSPLHQNLLAWWCYIKSRWYSATKPLFWKRYRSDQWLENDQELTGVKKLWAGHHTVWLQAQEGLKVKS